MEYEHPTAPGAPIGKKEEELRSESAMASIVANIVGDAKKVWQDEMATELENLRAPIKPEILNTEGEPVIRLVSPHDRQYRRMTEEEREWRSADSDHWNAEWLRGQVARDHGRKLKARAELEKIYGRAVMTEGVAAAGGAISTGTGGELIPRPLEQVVLIARDRVAKMRRWAQMISMTAQTHTVPTAAAMTAAMAEESTTAADGNPAIAQVQLTARKGQVTALATNEMLADAAINLINLWATRGGTAMGVLEDDQFFKTGNGTLPNISGILTGTAYAEETSTEMSFYDMVVMYYNVAQQYRQNAVWLISPDVLLLLTSVQNSTSGTQLYLGMSEKPGPITDDPTAEGTILRRPVYEVPSTPGTVWFGDINASYIIGQRAGIESRVSDQVKFDLDQVMWKLTQRFDGISVDAVASQVALGITSANDIRVPK